MSHFTVVVTQKFVIEASTTDEAITKAEDITYLNSIQLPDDAQRVGTSIDTALVE